MPSSCELDFDSSATVRQGRAVLPTSDQERAKAWYAEKLGLTPITDTEQGCIYQLADNTYFCLFPSAGKSNGTHTQMMIRVDDIDAQVSTLRDAGVEFEEYDLPGFKNENGLVEQGEGMRSDWCRGSEGNLLAILQMPDERFGIRHVDVRRGSTISAQ